MVVHDESGGVGMYPGNGPARGEDMKKKQSHGSETQKAGVGDGAAAAAAGGAEILQALQRSRGQQLLSGYLMTLVK